MGDLKVRGQPVTLVAWNGSEYVNVVAQSDGSLQIQSTSRLVGYSDQLLIYVFAGDSDAGDHQLQSEIVPSGELWVVKAIGAWDWSSGLDYIELHIFDSPERYRFSRVLTPLANQMLSWQGEVILKPTQSLIAHFGGVTLHDALELNAVGYIMEV